MEIQSLHTQPRSLPTIFPSLIVNPTTEVRDCTSSSSRVRDASAAFDEWEKTYEIAQLGKTFVPFFENNHRRESLRSQTICE